MSRVVAPLLALTLLLLAAAPAAGGHGGLWHTTERISVSSAGAEGDRTSYGKVSISADGRFVVFSSEAFNLVVDDNNGDMDVFVRDRQAGTTERASVSSAGAEGNDYSWVPSISTDGRYVAFSSEASNLVEGDNNGVMDVFVRDRQAGTTERVSVSSAGGEGNDRGGGSISADGRFIVFASFATNLVEDDNNGIEDVFVHDRQTGATERVSVSSAGDEGNSNSYLPSVSADGRFVAFASYASNLVADDSNGRHDVFVRDRQTGTTERVSVSSAGAQGFDTSWQPSISADGRTVAFESNASNLVAGDSNGRTDVFVRDRQTGTTERVSLSSAGAEGNHWSLQPSISADGRFVAFMSYASNLVAGDNNGRRDVFVRDRQIGTTERASVSSAGAEGNGWSDPPSLSADGRTVAFASNASNLVVGDTNETWDVFVAARTEVANTSPSVTAGAARTLLYTHRTWTLRVASFTDPDAGDTHTATVAWGDGTITPGVVDEQVGTVTGSHRYAAPGPYTVTVTVTDRAGASAEGSFQVVVRPHPRLPQ